MALRARAGGLPTSPFDVFVGLDGQFVATLQAAALKDGAPVGSCHAGAEAMHAHAAADFWLIRSLGHSTFLFLGKDDYTIPGGMGVLSWTAHYFTPGVPIRSI